MPHLKGREHVTVGQPEERMRVTVTLDVAELPGEARMRRVGQIEDETLARPEAVGEELPVGRHLVLGVMRSVPEPGTGSVVTRRP